MSTQHMGFCCFSHEVLTDNTAVLQACNTPGYRLKLKSHNQPPAAMLAEKLILQFDRHDQFRPNPSKTPDHGQRLLIIEKYVQHFFDGDYTPLKTDEFGHKRSYRSYDSDRLEREDALREYLTTPPIHPGKVDWGRTMVAEKACEGILNAFLAPAMARRNMVLRSTPTDLDHSDFNTRDCYKKGCDYVLMRSSEKPGQYPSIQLGIDLTIAREEGVECKQDKFGMNTDGFPVIILPIRDLEYMVFDGIDYYKEDFNSYCDRILAPAIRNGEPIEPFMGLSRSEIWEWRIYFGEKLRDGIQSSRESLMYTRDERVTKYEHLKDIFQKLNYAEEMVIEFQRCVGYGL